MSEPTRPHRSGRRTLRVSLLGALLAATALAGFAAGESQLAVPIAAATNNAPATTNDQAALPNFVSLIATAKPAVVLIVNKLPSQPVAMEGRLPGTLPFPFPFGSPPGQLQPVEALGSGFIISPSGYIVTNNHVVTGEESLTVTLDDGTKLPARVIGTDPQTDLAVLKVNAGHPLPFVRFGNYSDVKPGQWVLAMGNPFGLGGTATAGIVSALGRNIDDSSYDQFIQTDAPINHGNSGGPLFNLQGQVIGVNTAIASPSGGSVGIGFAIPSNTARKITTDLIRHGRVPRGYLGVAAQLITPAMQQALHLSSDKGALIASVRPGTPADRAALHPGEVITAVDGDVVNNPRDLASAIAAVAPGHQVHLEVLDKATSTGMTMTLASTPN
jgi:serine protease Do